MTGSSPQSSEDYRRIAARAGVPFVRLRDADHAVNPLAARLLPRHVCEQLGIVAIAYRDGVVTVAAADPGDEAAAETARAITGRQVRFVVAPAQDIERVIREVLPSAAPTPARPDGDAKPRLGELLVGHGLVTTRRVEEAVTEQQRSGDRLGQILVSRGDITEEALTGALAEQLDLPIVDLAQYEPEPEAVAILPAPLARDLGCLPLAVDEGSLYVAVSDVQDDSALDPLRELAGVQLRLFLATPSAIEEVIGRVYCGSGGAEGATGGAGGAAGGAEGTAGGAAGAAASAEGAAGAGSGGDPPSGRRRWTSWFRRSEASGREPPAADH